MDSDPLLTLIVPAYNASDCIRTCLDDLSAQTFTDFKVLLMDDGSTDATAAIGDEYTRRDARIQVVRLPHSGVSAARNRGLELADSRFVAFMDSDDRVGPDYLATFFRTPLPEGDMLVCQGVAINYIGQNRSEYYDYPDTDSTDLTGTIVRYRLLRAGWTYCKLFSLRMIREYGLRFDTKLSICEDLVFVLDYLSHIQRLILRSGTHYRYQVCSDGKSLSQRRQPSAETRHAGVLILARQQALAEQFGITDPEFLSEIYCEHGFMNLARSASTGNAADSRAVHRELACNREIFNKYYNTRLMCHPIVGKKTLRMYLLLPEALHLLPHWLIRLRHFIRRVNGRRIRY